MPTSSIIHKKCPRCGRLVQVVREKRIGDVIKLMTYQCGHISTEKIVHGEEDFYTNYVTDTGKSAYKFQVEGMKFLEAANFRAHLGDEMGLGKTIQGILPIKAHPDLLTPYLVLCKSGLKIQWFKAIVEWLGEEYMPQVIDASEAYYLKGVKGYVVSLDLLRRIKNKTKSRNGGAAAGDLEIRGPEDIELDGLTKLIRRLGVKYVILDECQLVKNLESQRTKAVQTIAKEVPYFVSMSGSAIENHAAEYYPILNMLRADKFPRKSTFDYQWVVTYRSGWGYKYGGLINPKAFAEHIKDFIIRRKRVDVLPDLPLVSRNFQFFELEAELEELYRLMYKQFQDEFGGGGGLSFAENRSLMAYLAEMRHITGMAKVTPCLDFVTDFLLESTRKLTIFTHHIDVADKLQRKIDEMLDEGSFGYRTLRLEGGLTADKRDTIQTQFLTGPERVLIASTLAAGEGLNLQACSDCIILEQQWVPTKEEQAECRFVRPGQLADKVSSTYFIAVGTIDEYLAEIKSRKRSIGKQTLDFEETKWDEQDIMKELMEVLATKGGEKWGW